MLSAVHLVTSEDLRVTQAIGQFLWRPTAAELWSDADGTGTGGAPPMTAGEIQVVA